MKVTKKRIHLPEFATFADLWYITQFTHINYDPIHFNCKQVCEAIAEKYANVEPVVASVLIHNGKMETNCHTVLKITEHGYTFIIDPTADQYSYENDLRLAKQMSPWIYARMITGEYDGEAYLSLNHMPLNDLIDESIESDFDLVRVSLNPYNATLKCIIL